MLKEGEAKQERGSRIKGIGKNKGETKLSKTEDHIFKANISKELHRNVWLELLIMFCCLVN